MTDFWTVAGAWLAMIGIIIYTIILSFGIGMAHDSIVNPLRDMGIDGGAGTAWDVSGYVQTIDHLMYFCLFIPAPLGIIIFILSVTRRQRKDDYNTYEPGALYHQEE